ncbi:MAG: hypothetical protein MUC65_05335 [Pontiellaceae bacterium]|nr:hypothetical protein [Pontiellaceae bacterium]
MPNSTRQTIARWIAAEEGQFFERKSALDRFSKTALPAAGMNGLPKNNYKKGFLSGGPISYKYVNTCAVPLVRKEDAHNGRIFVFQSPFNRNRRPQLICFQLHAMISTNEQEGAFYVSDKF